LQEQLIEIIASAAIVRRADFEVRLCAADVHGGDIGSSTRPSVWRTP